MYTCSEPDSMNYFIHMYILDFNNQPNGGRYIELQFLDAFQFDDETIKINCMWNYHHEKDLLKSVIFKK